MKSLFSSLLFALLFVSGPAFASGSAPIAFAEAVNASSDSVTVAVMDFDFDSSDSRIRSFLRFDNGIDFSGADWKVFSDSERPHGSQVAGVIHSRLPAKSSVILVPYNLHMASDKVFEAVDLAIKRKIKVINMSFAVDQPTKEYMARFEDAASRALKAGVVLVVAAGNEARDLDRLDILPATLANRFDNVITVGASDRRDQRWAHSNFGKAVTLFALGENIPILVPGGTSVASGTSEAAPIVTAVVAQLRSRFPKLSPGQIKQILIQTVDRSDAFSSSKSGGRLNARRAFDLAARISSGRRLN